jgi:hypothetical protein
MNHDYEQMDISPPGANTRDAGASGAADDRFVAHTLREALADTQVREVSLAEFLAELRKCGRQLA